MNEFLLPLAKEDRDIARRLFVAREEQRACDMQRYWANCSAPIDMEDIVIELFWWERKPIPIAIPDDSEIPF